MKNKLWFLVFALFIVAIFSYFVLSFIDPKWLIVALISGTISLLISVLLIIYNLTEKEKKNEKGDTH